MQFVGKMKCKTGINERSQAIWPGHMEKKMKFIENYRNWKKVRQTSFELAALSNRELNDLGISRSDIPFIARRSAGI